MCKSQSNRCAFFLTLQRAKNLSKESPALFRTGHNAQPSDGLLSATNQNAILYSAQNPVLNSYMKLFAGFVVTVAKRMRL
jgi:hypothetical protein